MTFQLHRDGLQLFAGLINNGELAGVEELLGPTALSAGVRIFGRPELERWLRDGPVGCAAKPILGGNARPVRAILFDKTPDRNWALGWHQDRTIAVRDTVQEPGFDHWTVKSGTAHVEPPFAVIENMVTARIHLDPVDEGNSPLLVSPGSHGLGRIAEPDVEAIVERCGTVACLANRGDVWLYKTSILHASERSKTGSSRRVLQVDFAKDQLPGQLRWLGVA